MKNTRGSSVACCTAAYLDFEALVLRERHTEESLAVMEKALVRCSGRRCSYDMDICIHGYRLRSFNHTA